MIRNFFAKRRAKNVLGKYVTPETLDAILRDKGNFQRKFTSKRIEFVLIFVAGEKPEEISEIVGRVADVATEYNGATDAILGPLIMVTFGASPHATPAEGKRALLVAQLGRDLSKHIKIIHGAADGQVGNIGGKTRMAYGSIIPNFDAILGRLNRLELGQVEEFIK